MPNRLAEAPSPYLQQHKDNPVDWWPWCDEAFEEARRRDVPVFLSIGYATCHWCHVMAHESFEDEDVADLLNAAFVCIKVDREERPDIDGAYMQACQAMTGRGGWPLTAVLDHDRRPWFSGTYFPAHSRPGAIGMVDLVPRLASAWRERREDVLHDAAHLIEHLRAAPKHQDDPIPGTAALAAATETILGQEDREHGGFTGPPKFPSLQTVRFLLRRGAGGHEQALDAACRQLDAMADGGIRDHVGGGFHRYSTDARWFLPHFEKMLYDQGMALLAYAEAHMLRPKPAYAKVLRETAAYLLRDMRHESGAFFSAEDADSEGEEGRFYTWPWDALLDVLDGDTDLASALGALPEGNHVDEATRRPVPRNHLYAADPALAGPLKGRWEAAKPALLRARSTRPRPLRDEKVLADWNGLAIAGLAAAGRALGDPGILAAAESAFRGAIDLLGAGEPGGGLDETSLRHAWIAGRTGEQVFAEDHAGMAFAAAHLANALHRPFYAAVAGSFIRTADGFRDGRAVRRSREASTPIPEVPEGHDGALPSTNALLAEAVLLADRLLFGHGPARAIGLLEAFAGQVARHAPAFTGLLSVADDLASDHASILIVADDDGPFRDVLAAHAHPRLHALITDGSDDWVPEYRPEIPFDRRPRAYLCHGDACEAAGSSPEALADTIERALAGSPQSED